MALCRGVWYINKYLGLRPVVCLKSGVKLVKSTDKSTDTKTVYDLYSNNGNSGSSGNTGGSSGTETPNPQEPKSPIEQAKENGNYFDEETTLEDSNGNHVVIPAGFKVAEDSGNNVTEGIVIEDDDKHVDGNGNERGNQYVWIPVSNIDGSDSNPIKKSDGKEIVITLGRYEFADGKRTYYKDYKKQESLGVLPTGTEILKQTAQNYSSEVKIESDVVQYYYIELSTFREGKEGFYSNEIGENRTAKELGKFVESVEQNGGYYFARYEASYGTDNKPNSKVSNNSNYASSVPTQEGDLWNCIQQKDAGKVCENIYKTINSDLVNSYAWDTALVYIQKFSNDSDYSRQTAKNNGIVDTGKNNDEVCKINDMASNCSEWSTEYHPEDDSYEEGSGTTYPCVYRGPYNKRELFYTSSRFTARSSIYDAMNRYTFRPILYINPKS